ncbi:MAG: hypothetical protein AAFQ63_11360 [Cyanobacteria bacterium J06621_11]
MTPAISPTRFPLWQYLSQPIGQEGCRLIVNPRKFWHTKKLRHIERCWVMGAYLHDEEKTM